jgi:prepilin signal peptidase PulO-like enzyme (type II secretory pathway)
MTNNLFAAAATMEPRFVISGIIWAALMGLIAGNYASSLIHRLPRGKSLLEKAAHCGSCGTLLQVRDLFPVFSATLLGHRCRYCGTSFPSTYTLIEIILGLVFVPIFLQFGFGDVFVLIGVISTFFVIIAAIEINDNVLSGKAMVVAAIAGMLLRTHVDGQLFHFVLGGLFGAIAGAVIWRKSITKVGHIYKLPKQAELMVTAGICVGSDAFVKFLVLLAAASVLFWVLSKVVNKKFCVSVAFATSVIAVLIFG